MKNKKIFSIFDTVVNCCRSNLISSFNERLWKKKKLASAKRNSY